MAVRETALFLRTLLSDYIAREHYIMGGLEASKIAS